MRCLAPANVRVVDTPEAVEMEDGSWLLPAPLEHRKTVLDPTAAMVDMATPPGAVRIGLAHGSITEFGATGESSNLIPPDRARSAGLDYLALGDWHGYLAVGDRTAYSGTPETDRHGREGPGACVAVEARAGDAPRFERVEIGHFRWLSRRWDVETPEDLERALAALRGEGGLFKVLLSLKFGGVAIVTSIEDRLAHELRHLDLDGDGLMVKPTLDDVAQIDVQGTLARASSILQALADAGGTNSQAAAAALERLYVEAMRYDAEAVR